MMKRLIFFSTLCLKMAIASPALYVVGEDYLLYSESKSSWVLLNGISAQSYALDAQRCRLWVTTDGEPELSAFEKGQKLKSTAFSGQIISDFSQGQFATVSKTGEIQWRNEEGAAVSQFIIQDSGSLIQVSRLSSGESWGLFHKGNRTEPIKNELWLRKMNSQGEELQKLVLDPAEEFWGKVQFFVDELRNRLWVGYARASAHHAYAPKVEKFSLTGVQEGSHQWDERGFFFDGCVNDKGDFLVARDLPSSPYTVPDYSYIEKMEGQGKLAVAPERMLELETNRLVDSMACHSKSTFFATHSIFGGEPKQLLSWSGNEKEAPEMYLNLPATAKKVFVCEGDSN